MSADRESTQEWLVTDPAEGPAPEPRVYDNRSGNGPRRGDPPPPETDNVDESARRTELALQSLDRRVGSLEASTGAAAEFASELERGLGRAHDAALEAANRARSAAELARSSSERVENLTERAESALRTLEAREVADRRRAAEASFEEQAMRSFSERADRIVERLRMLE